MSDLVYTQFGYGKVETQSQPKTIEVIVQADQAKPIPEEPAILEIQAPAEEITEDVSPEKIVKVVFKWGGFGYLPVK
jgi:hypothetical protein